MQHAIKKLNSKKFSVAVKTLCSSTNYWGKKLYKAWIRRDSHLCMTTATAEAAVEAGEGNYHL